MGASACCQSSQQRPRLQLTSSTRASVLLPGTPPLPMPLFPPDRAVEDGAGVDYLRGWQRRASRACEERALETHFPDLSPASQALLLLKPAYTPAVCLRSSPPPTMSLSSARSFGFCCSVGCVFPWRSAPAHADAAGASTRWGTTEPPVPLPVSFRLGRYRSSTPSPASAAKTPPSTAATHA